GSGLCWALAVGGLRWLSAAPGRGSPAAAVVSGNLTAFLVSLPMALPVGSHGPGDWAIIGYLGIFQIALVYLFGSTAIHSIPALETSRTLLMQPVLKPAWASAI